MMLASRRREDLPDHEELLLDYARRLRNHLQGRRAVHVHLSKLKPQNRKPHHIRIAVNGFDRLVTQREGQIFRMRNCDLVIVVRNASLAEMDADVLKLRYLFAEDPLADSDPAEGSASFCTWYDLERDYAAFLEDVEGIYRRYQDDRKAPPVTGSAVVDQPAEQPQTPLDPLMLGRLETQLENTDITGLIRRQAICALLPGARPKPVLMEIFVSIEELRRRSMPDVDLAANRWLFQHLTELLDRRLLRAVPDLKHDSPIASSVNMNIATILSEPFLGFDRELRRHTSKSMVMELQSVDIFADMGAYMFARDFLHDRGYKICLDGLSHLTFPLINRDALGLDLEKVTWTPDMASEMKQRRRDAFRVAVERAGPSRVILCRCDDETAITFGQSLGITLFQGRWIDKLLQAR